MANEIVVVSGLQVNNGNLVVPNPPATRTFDQTTARGGGPGTVDVATSEGTIGFGDIVPGWVELRNLDGTNFVELGFSTGVYGMVLPVNGVALFYLKSGATLYAKADTAGCKVQVAAANI